MERRTDLHSRVKRTSSLDETTCGAHAKPGKVTTVETLSMNANSKEALSIQKGLNISDLALEKARRTAFIARFIVLRESKRSRAHRAIELLEWQEDTTAEELAKTFRTIFVENGDNMEPVDRDIRRALAHANRSLTHFVKEYVGRSTANFVEALVDYERSNSLLFGADDQPKPGGWRLPREITKVKDKP